MIQPRALAILLLAAVATGSEAAGPLDSIRLPKGFAIALYAGGASGARSMAQGDRGTLFVGTRREGNVYAILDRDGDHVADDGLVIATGLLEPNGVAFRDGALFVADGYRILRFDRLEDRLENPPAPVVVYDGFPRERWHGWKYIRFGPDGLLYVGVGAPCNVCVREPPLATITRMKRDGTGLEVFAKGVRNTLGFDWHPDTKELWFTDNGRDGWGDDSPPDELNRAPRAGLDFGFPRCHGAGIPEREPASAGDCGGAVPPVIDLAPHAAALGMRFYGGTSFPEAYRSAIFVAEHGSGERSEPLGYRVMVARPEAKGASRYESFAEGWLRDGRPWGRPVDVLVTPDGALLVSDDLAGAIYRISYDPAAAE